MAVPYTISLQDGWNTISFPGVLEQGRLSDVLPSTVSFVLAYRDGKWVSAIWNENAWQGGLEQVEAGYGYWVYSTGFCDVNAVLAPLEDYRPTLLEGWNLIGCVDKHLQPAGDCTGDMLTLDEYLDGLEWQSAYTLQRHIRVLDDEPPEIPPHSGFSLRCASAYWVFVGDAAPTERPPDPSWVFESDSGSRMGR